MKKAIIIIISIIMSISLYACTSKNISGNSEISNTISETSEIGDLDYGILLNALKNQNVESKESEYEFILNAFELRDQKVIDDIYKTEFIPENGFYDQATWNDPEDHTYWSAPIYFISEANYEDTTIYFGLLTNEDYSRTALYWVGILNPDENEFQKLLDSVDYHSVEHIDILNDTIIPGPYGYIATYDSYILVNDGIETKSILDISWDSKVYELCNLEGLAYVLGIDIQDAITNAKTLEDMYIINNNLNEAIYYGIRGYDAYLNTNGFGVIIPKYEDLVDALNDTETGPLSEISYLTTYGGSDPTSDPSSEYYEPEVSQNTVSESLDGLTAWKEAMDNLYGNMMGYNASTIPQTVQDYMNSGYEVYKITENGLHQGYYYKTGLNEWSLIMAIKGNPSSYISGTTGISVSRIAF